MQREYIESMVAIRRSSGNNSVVGIPCFATEIDFQLIVALL